MRFVAYPRVSSNPRSAYCVQWCSSMRGECDTQTFLTLRQNQTEFVRARDSSPAANRTRDPKVVLSLTSPPPSHLPARMLGIF